MNKVDNLWQKIFDDFGILQEIKKHGFFNISADEIRKYREVRLMTKFDHYSDLPDVFRKNHLAILPLSRRVFVIGPFQCYQGLKDDLEIKPKYMPLPDVFETLSPDTIRGEQAALFAATLAGIMDDFIGEGQSPLVPTVEGRQGSDKFSFKIKSTNGGNSFRFDVDNSQLEIDLGYENDACVVLVEAKMFLDSDFLVRQLFYPYMRWKQYVTKPIHLVYLAYCDGIYKLFQFQPTGDDYNGLKLIKQANYTIHKNTISLLDIKNLMNRPLVSEPSIPFPQANSVERILNMLDYLYEKAGATSEQVTIENEFVSRQANYYMCAMQYLGLVEGGRGMYQLTPKGVELATSDIKARHLGLAGQMIEHEVFRLCLKAALSQGDIPDQQEIVDTMKKSNLYNVNSESTYTRRSSTINSWIYWILNLITPDNE